METEQTQNPDSQAEIVCLDCGNPYPIGEKYCPVCGAWPPIAAVLLARKAAAVANDPGSTTGSNGSEAKGKDAMEANNASLDIPEAEVKRIPKPDEAPTINRSQIQPDHELDQAPTVMIRRVDAAQAEMNGLEAETPTLARPVGWMNEAVLQRMVSVLKIRNRIGEGKELIDAIEREPSNSGAWLALSEAARSDIEKRACLQKVLEISPNSSAALEKWQNLPPTPWPRDELRTQEYEMEAQPSESAPEPQNLSTEYSEPQTVQRQDKVFPTDPGVNQKKSSNSWLRRIVVTLLVAALLISQVWQLYRINELERSVSSTRATLVDFQKLVIDLTVQVETLKRSGR
jgi:hypothetical protein